MSDAPSERGDRPALAATVHDPDDHLLAGLHRAAPALGEVFSAFGVLATEPTSSDVVTFLERDIGASVERAPADGSIGRHRRMALRLAGAGDVLYSDLDNLLRWIETDRDEIHRLCAAADADLTVVGRTDGAMAACPRRLRETEAIVNHVYALATGRRWDLMFAIRLLSPGAVHVILHQGVEDSIANDIEWPLLAERSGLTVGYCAADGLSYRVRQDFDAARDRYDHPLRWIQRVEIADLHCQVLKRFIEQPTASSNRAERSSGPGNR